MNRAVMTLIVIVFTVFGIGLTAFTFNKCGMKTFFLGNGGAYAAFSGMCDEK